MRFEKYKGCVRYLYHYTTAENAERIISEKRVNTGCDRFCFFTQSVEDARLLFAELMQKSIDYIDDGLQVEKRIPQSAENYVILKIEAQNDSEFYRFLINTDKFNPYEYSLLHKGTLQFEHATVLPMIPPVAAYPKTTELRKRTRFAPIWKKAAAACFVAAMIGINSVSAFAVSDPIGSWKNSGYYDTSWYNSDTGASSYRLTTAEQFAGLAVLVDGGTDFEGKYINLGNDMDFTAHNWETISSEKFKGVIEGLHKTVTLFSNTTPLVDSGVRVIDLDDIRYVNNTITVSYNVAPTYTVTIPASVTLGDTVTVSAENVVVEKGKQVEVKLSGTSGTDNAFMLKTAEGAEILYGVTNSENAVNVGDVVLTVNPDDGASGSAALRFVAPSKLTYAGTYTGTVTFTVSVENE